MARGTQWHQQSLEIKLRDVNLPSVRPHIIHWFGVMQLNDLVDKRAISRFGCILRHRAIGYRANAMAVWDVPDNRVDAIAERLAAVDVVTLCYRRTRRKPDWPFNLFAMIHGRDRNTVLTQIKAAALASGLTGFQSAVLFSRRCFKQSVAQYCGNQHAGQKTGVAR